MKQVVKGTALVAAALAVLVCGGCAVVAVADAAVTVAATVVKTGVKVTGAVVGAMIPGSED